MSQEYTFSSKILNYVESYNFNNVLKTKFFTEHDNNYSVGDILYIVGGNYDNEIGYKILAIDDSLGLVLDIDYDGTLPFNDIDIDKLTTVYLVDSDNKLNYEKADNSFNFYNGGGKKYSLQNNSIFLSKLTSLDNTTAPYTYNKFFKTYENPLYYNNYLNKYGYLYSSTSSYINTLATPSNVQVSSVQGDDSFPNYYISVAAYNYNTGARSPFSTPIQFINGGGDGISISFNIVPNANHYVIKFEDSGNSIYAITTSNTNIFYDGQNLPSDFYNEPFQLQFNNITDIATDNTKVYAVDKGTTYSNLWNHSYQNINNSFIQTISATYYAVTTVPEYNIVNLDNSYVYGLPIGFYMGYDNNLDTFGNPIMSHTSGGFSYDYTNGNFLAPTIGLYAGSGNEALAYNIGGDDIYLKNFIYSYGYKGANISSITIGVSDDNTFPTSTVISNLVLRIYGYKYNKNAYGKFNNLSNVDLENLSSYTVKPVLLATSTITTNYGSFVINLSSELRDTYNIYEFNLEYASGFTQTDGSLYLTYINFQSDIQYTETNISKATFSNILHTSRIKGLTSTNTNVALPLDNKALYLLPITSNGVGDNTVTNVTKNIKINSGLRHIERNPSNNIHIPIMIQGDSLPISFTTNNFKNIGGGYTTIATMTNDGIYVLANDVDKHMTYSSYYGLNISSYKVNNILNLATFSTVYDIEWVDNVDVPNGYTASYPIDNLINTYFTPSTRKWDQYIITTDKGVYYLYLNFKPDVLPDKLGDRHRIYLSKIDSIYPTFINNNDVIKSISSINYNNTRYFIGGNKGGGNTYSTMFNLGSTSSFPFTYNTSNGLTLSSVLYFDQTDTFQFSFNGSGLVLFDMKTKVSYNINTTTNVDYGTKLPSNKVSKSINIYNGYSNFTYNITDKGVYRITNNNNYIYDYFYTIDFDGGKTNLNSNINRDNNIYITETFEYNGDQFIKGNVYKYNYVKRKWDLDISYMDTYITSTHVKKAKIGNLNWNDGIFGDLYDRNTLVATNSTFNNGIYINVDITNVNIKSKSDILTLFKYNKLKNGAVSHYRDTTNNDGFGYNLIVNSNLINSITISNGTLNDSYIGYTVSNNVFYNSLFTASTTYSNITILKSKLNNSILNSVNINNASLYNSLTINSNISNSKIISSDSKKSHINNSYINNKGEVKIYDFDIWTNLITDVTDSNKVGLVYIYKFYIKEEDIIKFKFNDKIKISNISSSKRLNYLNNSNIYINSGTSNNGFYNEYYEDIDSLVKYNHDILVSVRKSNLNTLKTTVSDLNTVNSVDNPIKLASLDITYVRYYNKSDDLNNILSDSNYYFKINSISDAFISINDFDNTYIENSTIEYLSDIQNKNLIIDTFDSYLNMRLTSTSSLNITVSTINNINTYEVGDILNLSNVYYNGRKIDGFFDIKTYSNNNITLGATLSYSKLFATATLFNQFATFSTDISKKIYLNNNVFRKNTISNGIFSGSKLKENTFINSSLIPTYIYNNIQNNDNNTYSGNNIQLRAYIVNSNIINGIYENSIILNSRMNNINSNKTAIVSSTVSGLISNSNISTLIPTIGSVSYASMFISSNFVNGTMSNSTLINTVVSNGVLNKSLFMSGNIIQGVLNDTNVLSGILTNTTVNSGVIGYDVKYLGNINFEKYKKYSKIYITQSGVTFSGTFNSGILTSGEFNTYTYSNLTENIYYNFGSTISIPTTWINGVVNNGTIVNKVKWLNGIFNNGNFQSIYGDGYDTYSWDNGYFNNGKFGNGTLSSTSWKNGVFNGGIFIGKIWNNGTFIKGNFIGSADSTYIGSSNNLLHSSTDPQTFVNKYNTNPNFYGLWRNGSVKPTILDSNYMIATNTKDLIQADKYKTDSNRVASFKNMLWVKGEFDNQNAIMENSVWLSGTFSDGEFKYSSFNPFVERKNYSSSTSSAVWSMDLTKNAIWNNGKLNKSNFFISEFKNGVILGGKNDLTNINDQKYGSLVGAYVKNATSYYVNAYNTIWKDGNWKNGNWYGAEFANDISTIPVLEYLKAYNYGLTFSQNKFVQYSLIKNFERYNTLNGIESNTASGGAFIWNSMLSNNISTPFGYTANWITYSSTNAASGVLSSTNSLMTIGTLGMNELITPNVNGSIGSVSYYKTQVSLTAFEYDSTNTYLYNMYNVPTNTISNIILTPTIDFGLSSSSVLELRINSVTISKYTTVKFYYEKSPNTYALLNSGINESYASGGAEVFVPSKSYTLTWDNLNTIPTRPKIKIEVSNYVANNVNPNGTLNVATAGFNIVYQIYNSVKSATYSSNNNTMNATISWNRQLQPINDSISYYAFSSYSYSVTSMIVPTSTLSYQTNYNGKNATIYTQIGNGAMIGNSYWENGVWNSGINNINSFNSKPNTIIADQVLSAYKDKGVWYIKIGVPVTSINEIHNSYLNILDLFKDDNANVVNTGTSILTDTKIAISNISLLDINNNKIYINEILTASLDLITNKRVVNYSDLAITNYKSNNYYSFTAKFKDISNIGLAIIKSSERHYIYVSRKIFKYIKANNGLFEGVYNNVLTNGFPYTLKFENSHFNNAVYKGGSFKSNEKIYAGIGYTSTASVANNTTVFETGISEIVLSNNIVSNSYPNNKVSTGLIQNMEFYDGLLLDVNGRLPKNFATSSPYDYAYNYITNIDAVWHDSEVASIYDKDLSEWKGFYKDFSNVAYPKTSFNVPVGQVTYDILNSVSYINFEKGTKIFNASASGYVFGDKITRKLNLGVNTKEVILLEKNFLNAPNPLQANPSDTVTYSISDYGMISYQVSSMSNIYPYTTNSNVIINVDGINMGVGGVNNSNNFSIGGLTAFNGSKYQKIEIEFNIKDSIPSLIDYNADNTKYIQLDLGYNIYMTQSSTFISNTTNKNAVTNNLLINGNKQLNRGIIYINNNENIYRHQLFLRNKGISDTKITMFKVTELENIPFFNLFTQKSNTSGGLSWSNIPTARSIYKNITIPNSDVSDDLRSNSNM